MFDEPISTDLPEPIEGDGTGRGGTGIPGAAVPREERNRKKQIDGQPHYGQRRARPGEAQRHSRPPYRGECHFDVTRHKSFPSVQVISPAGNTARHALMLLT